jgi:hypothetical protein
MQVLTALDACLEALRGRGQGGALDANRLLDAAGLLHEYCREPIVGALQNQVFR